jgi:hypothetical protein
MEVTFFFSSIVNDRLHLLKQCSLHTHIHTHEEAAAAAADENENNRGLMSTN